MGQRMPTEFSTFAERCLKNSLNYIIVLIGGFSSEARNFSRTLKLPKCRRQNLRLQIFKKKSKL